MDHSTWSMSIENRFICCLDKINMQSLEEADNIIHIRHVFCHILVFSLCPDVDHKSGLQKHNWTIYISKQLIQQFNAVTGSHNLIQKGGLLSLVELQTKNIFKNLLSSVLVDFKEISTQISQQRYGISGGFLTKFLFLALLWLFS